MRFRVGTKYKYQLDIPLTEQNQHTVCFALWYVLAAFIIDSTSRIATKRHLNYSPNIPDNY